VALISMPLLPVILLLGRGDYGDLRLLAATVTVPLLANVVVCGVFPIRIAMAPGSPGSRPSPSC
jgi:hypothetical protein